MYLLPPPIPLLLTSSNPPYFLLQLVSFPLIRDLVSQVLAQATMYNSTTRWWVRGFDRLCINYPLVNSWRIYRAYHEWKGEDGWHARSTISLRDFESAVAQDIRWLVDSLRASERAAEAEMVARLERRRPSPGKLPKAVHTLSKQERKDKYAGAPNAKVLTPGNVVKKVLSGSFLVRTDDVANHFPGTQKKMRCANCMLKRKIYKQRMNAWEKSVISRLHKQKARDYYLLLSKNNSTSKYCRQCRAPLCVGCFEEFHENDVVRNIIDRCNQKLLGYQQGDREPLREAIDLAKKSDILRKEKAKARRYRRNP